MNKIFLILASIFILILTVNIISASDVLVWQGQYFTGTTFNVGTYQFNFTVYDALTGGNVCYSNTTTLTTGNFGEWRTEQNGVSSACNNASKDYYLNININGIDQTPRRRLAIWNFLRKNVDEVTTAKLQIDSQVMAPIVNATQIIANELSINSNANILGVLRGHSPVKIGDAIQFVDTNDTNLFSIYTAGQNITGSNVSSQYYGVIIHQIETHTNPFEIEECWWDKEDQEMRMCMDKNNIEMWNNLLVNKNINVTGNVTASYFVGDGSYLTGINSSSTNLTNYALKNQSETFAGNITTTQTGFFGWLGSLTSRIIKLWVVDINATGNIETDENVSAKYFKGDGSLLTNLPAGIESDPKWSANFTNMQTDCLSNNYAYGINVNGTIKCRQDQIGSGSGLTPVYLESNLNATNADYTTLFTIALTPSKINIIRVYLAQSSSTTGVAIQNRAIISAAGPIGICSFDTKTGATGNQVDNIVLSTDASDTGITVFGIDLNTPFINIVACSVLADANQKNLIIQFQSETTANVTTYAGSYYTNAVSE